MLSPAQMKMVQVIRETKILPPEVDRAIQFLLDGGELEDDSFVSLVQALLRAPNLDGSDQVVGGIVHG